MLKISSIIKNKKVFFIIIVLLCIAFAGLWNVVSEGYDRQNKTILFLKRFIPTKMARKVRDIIFIIPAVVVFPEPCNPAKTIIVTPELSNNISLPSLPRKNFNSSNKKLKEI